MALRGSVSIKVGLREVKLVRRGVARSMTVDEERVNRQVALELAGAADWFEARDGEDLIELLGSNAGETHPRAPSARSERMVIERVRDDLERALRSGEVIAKERPAPPPPTLQAEAPPELPPPPLPRPRPEPEPAAPEPDLPPERVDQEFQAQTLRAAADQGAPFCEECAKARRGKDGPTPATHAAPEPPSDPL